MDKKFISAIILISLLLFTCTSMAWAADRSYTIPLINMELFPQEDGSLHVKETIHYAFSGTYNGVYRDVPLSGTQQLENVKVTTTGAYSRFTETNSSNNHRITVYLYSDSAKSSPVTNKEVDVVLEYDMTHVVKFYNDVAELQYKLVGEEWAVDVGKINANIHLKSSDGVKYWLNPPYYTDNSAWQGNTLQVTSNNIPTGNFYELRMIIPKKQFAANPTNGIIINQDGLSQIEQVQNDYQNQLNYRTFFYSILTVLMLLACLVPFIIYHRFGREPKIDYSAEYERDVPTDDPPAIVNAICGPGFSKKIGEPDMDGFKATIMDLIDRKYLTFFKEESDKDGYGFKEGMTLKINQDMDITKLKDFERDVINFLKGYEESGLISLDYISSNLKDKASAKSFRDTYNNWRNNIEEHYLNDDVLSKIFNKKGDTYLKIFGLGAIILAVVVFFFSITDPIPAAIWAWLSSIILGIVALISFIMPQNIAGQWTTYGEEYDAKWHNFKKYIQDFSLIREYPPESIAIWNKYLVYATALGVADNVRKAMELYLPKDELEGSNIYMFHYYGGYIFLSSTLDSGMATANAADSSGGGGFGGVGGVGGGFGGGGGGAF